jgi:hypothetical protein
MDRASNDATLKKVGDIYQYYIALHECFKMNEDEKIHIELSGDVSKISADKTSFQMEVKHHIGNDFISDRDVDFWKTLKNWVKEFGRIKSFNRLILYTTSNIDKNSLINGWNEKDKIKKLETIKEIGKISKEKEEGFRGLYNEIFASDENKIKSILAKFTIESKQKNILNIDNDFNQYISYVPEQNRKLFIASLLGIILSMVQAEPHIWEITYKEFVQIVQDQSPAYMKPNLAPLPTEFAQTKPTEEITETYNDKQFVRAIKIIEYDSEVPKAIIDNWRTNMTIVKYYRDNPVFNKNLLGYKAILNDKLFYSKEPIKLEHKDSERIVQIKESKKLYSSVMSWDAKPFGSVDPNQPFFQKGIIHNIVDDGGFTWDVGDEK